MRERVDSPGSADQPQRGVITRDERGHSWHVQRARRAQMCCWCLDRRAHRACSPRDGVSRLPTCLYSNIRHHQDHSTTVHRGSEFVEVRNNTRIQSQCLTPHMVAQDEPKALECFHSAGFGVCPKRSCCGDGVLRSPLARRRLTTLRSKQIFNELNSPNAPLRNGHLFGYSAEYPSPTGYEPKPQLDDLNSNEVANAQDDSRKSFCSL